MSPYRDCNDQYPDSPPYRPPVGRYPHPPRPCPHNYNYSHTYYKYAAVAVLVCGSIALLVIFWKCCRSKGGGRVVTQPQQQQPVKAIPLPYTPDSPPPYQACVSGNPHPQQFGGAKQQMPVSGPNSASNASAPPKYSSPTPTHVVNIPENRTRY